MGSLLGVFDSIAGYLLRVTDRLLVNRDGVDEIPDPVNMRNEPPVVVLHQPIQQQEHNKRRKVVLSSDFVACESQNQHVNMVVGWLKDDKITNIGIYGMPGIGKTTLAKLVFARLMSGVLVNGTGARVVDVGLVSVGSYFDVYKVQQNLAEAFGFDFKHEKDLIRRAGVLSACLSCIWNCVIIFDDLWTDFRREDVGIPKDCKLVLVSRSWDVCRVLRCQKLIKVEPLLEEESWELFCHILWSGELVSEEIQGIARHLCQECGGVPLAITAVASSLRVEIDTSEWSNVLDCLRRAPLRRACLEDYLNTLRRSYDRLNKKLSSCLLYCALYPEGYAISEEELIRLWIGEMLIGDTISLHAMYDMGHSIINKLLSSCLLYISEDKSRIKMHHLIRDMALSIAGDSFVVRSGQTLSDMSTEVEWHESLRVVALINSISQGKLDFSPKCANLSTLLLQHNDLHLLPESFFLNMLGLRVLNLSYTGIERLPSSFSALEELRVLDVSYCENLRELPSMANSTKLQFLDLSHTAVRQVPDSVRMLKMLTELNLSSNPKLIKVPKGLLPALSRLKKLSCEIIGINTELQSLTCLETLDASFSSNRDLSSYVRSEHWRNLECFHLNVGPNVRVEEKFSKSVSLKACSLNGQGEDNIVLPDNIQKLHVEECRNLNILSDILKSVNVNSRRKYQNCKKEDGLSVQPEAFSSLEACTIIRCHDLKMLFPSGWVQIFQHLEYISVENCGSVKELIAEETEGNHPVIHLPQLKRIDLVLLPELNSIYKGQLACVSLQTVTVMDCPRLNRIPFYFDKSNLSTLERIEGQEQWWELLQWEQPESRSLFKPFFRCSSSKDLGESSKTIHGSH